MTRLPFQITVCGIGELAGYGNARVSHVVSILDPGFPIPTEFEAYATHDRRELRFHDIIDERTDMVCPQPEHVDTLLRFVQQVMDEQRDGAHLLMHCHAGISRSTACAVLVMAKALPELPPSDLIDELLRVRPRVWPNFRIIEIGDELLGRRGALIDSVRRLYGLLLARDPGLRQQMLDGGRGRELAAALPADA